MSDLDQLVSTIQSGYGPLEFKEQLLGIRPDTLSARYAQETRAARNDREFYYSMVRFVSEFKDSHFGALLNSPRIASLLACAEGFPAASYARIFALALRKQDSKCG